MIKLIISWEVEVEGLDEGILGSYRLNTGTGPSPTSPSLIVLLCSGLLVPYKILTLQMPVAKYFYPELYVQLYHMF